MLPMVALRRLDCVMEPTKDAVLAEHKRLLAAKTPENAIPRLLTRMVDKDRKQPLFNVSPYTFDKLFAAIGTGARLLMARRYHPMAVDLFRVQNLQATCGSPSRFLLNTLKLAILELKSKPATENEAEPQKGEGLPPDRAFPFSPKSFVLQAVGGIAEAESLHPLKVRSEGWPSSSR